MPTTVTIYRLCVDGDMDNNELTACLESFVETGEMWTVTEKLRIHCVEQIKKLVPNEINKRQLQNAHNNTLEINCMHPTHSTSYAGFPVFCLRQK